MSKTDRTVRAPQATRVTRRRWLGMALGLGAAGVGAASIGAAMMGTSLFRSPHRSDGKLIWRERALLGFGTTLWLRAAHEDAGRLEAALDAAVATIRHIERQMSLFDADSALVRLNRDGLLEAPDADLVRVLELAAAVSSRSSGTFDVTVQPLWQAWQRAHAAGRAPSTAEITAARERVDWRAVDVGPHRIALQRPGMAITLNGIAQGYAADRVRQGLIDHAIEHAAIDTGEWISTGASPEGTPWTLGIADPRRRASIIAKLFADGRGVASSSDDRTSFSADHRHHHILDPRTGYSPTDIAAITIAAPSCALADALTKVLFMASADEALALAEQWGVDALVIDKSARWRATRGLVLG